MPWFCNRTLAAKLAVCFGAVVALVTLGDALALNELSRIATGATADEAARATGWTVCRALAGTAAAALLSCVALYGAVARPLARLVETARKLADGDLLDDVPPHVRAGRVRGDEIGAMDRALRTLHKDMRDARDLRAEQQQVRLRSKRDRSSFMTETASRFEEVVGTVVGRVSASANEMRSLAESLRDVAQRTTGEVETVADATGKTQASIQSVAGGTLHLSASVAEVNAMTTRCAEVTVQAVAEASRTMATIAGLSQSAEKIGLIVDMINNVARQTNLLALNATIEAARAGEAGRGFTIVAVEVKDLATQTATATADIRRQIEGMRATVAGSVTAIEQIGRTIGEMAVVSERVTEAVRKQSEETEAMMSGTRTVAALTANVASRLAGVTEAAATTGSAATNALEAAKSLALQADYLGAETRKFAAAVRGG